MKTFLAVMLFISIPAFADDWSSTDTKREAVYLTLHSMDWMQTRYIAKNPSEYSELNSILGEHPSVGKVNNYFVATALLHVGAAYILPSEYRKAFQYLTIGMEFGVVAHNYQIGINLDFP